MSNANKLLIRCAWASTSAFSYDSSWGPGTCPATFTTKASLQTAVRAYNANPTAAIATYGPIAEWDVSAITDMSYLFNGLKNFNTDISSWDTSSVTNMNFMFRVRSARALPPTALSRALPAHADCVAATQRPQASQPAPRRASHARFSTRQKASAFNQALSFDMSRVTSTAYMFGVRSARALAPKP